MALLANEPVTVVENHQHFTCLEHVYQHGHPSLVFFISVGVSQGYELISGWINNSLDHTHTNLGHGLSQIQSSQVDEYDAVFEHPTIVHKEACVSR